MTKFKKGSKFRFNANTFEIIDISDRLVLAKIMPDFSQAYYDISSLQLDNHNEERFYPSPAGNGLVETIDGAPKVPKSLEQMQLAFDNLVAAAQKRAISAAEAMDAAERREQAFIAKKRKVTQTQEHLNALNDKLRKMVAEADDVNDFIGSRRAKALAMEIFMSDLYKNNI